MRNRGRCGVSDLTWWLYHSLALLGARIIQLNCTRYFPHSIRLFTLIYSTLLIGENCQSTTLFKLMTSENIHRVASYKNKYYPSSEGLGGGEKPGHLRQIGEDKSWNEIGGMFDRWQRNWYLEALQNYCLFAWKHWANNGRSNSVNSAALQNSKTQFPCLFFLKNLSSLILVERNMLLESVQW